MSPKQASLVASLLVAIVFSAGPPGARPCELQQTPAPPIRVGSSLVLVDATVKDKSGNLIDGLTADDFRLLDDGSPQTITYFSRDSLPLAIVLMVDASASIVPYFDDMTESLTTALTALKREDQVSLFTFTFAVDKRVDLTADKGTIAGGLSGIHTGGSTNLNDALYKAAQYLDKRAPTMRRVIVLVSDNIPSQVSDYSPKDVENEILKADASVYSLKIPGDNPAGVERYIEQARGSLVDVAKVVSHTGGEVIDVTKGEPFSAAFATLIHRLKARYTLGYTPVGDSLQDGKYHSVETILTTEQCKHCRVEAKRGYFAERAGRVKK